MVASGHRARASASSRTRRSRTPAAVSASRTPGDTPAATRLQASTPRMMTRDHDLATAGKEYSLRSCARGCSAAQERRAIWVAQPTTAADASVVPRLLKRARDDETTAPLSAAVGPDRRARARPEDRAVMPRWMLHLVVTAGCQGGAATGDDAGGGLEIVSLTATVPSI